MKVRYPTFDEEHKLRQLGYKYIAGMDEVGRGAFAGPVVTAAVVLPSDFPQTLGIQDSKLLTARKRQKLAAIIKEKALAYKISLSNVEEINSLGIAKATQLSFQRSIAHLPTTLDFVLMDAFALQGYDLKRQKAIIRGDRTSLSIAAASIIAKVFRDDLMCKINEKYPNFSFALHKGYGTQKHRQEIRQHGLCPLHRTSFSLGKYLSS